MVSNAMFRRSIGGSAGSAPINTHAISVGSGKFDASRVSHEGYPAAQPARPVAEGTKPKMGNSSGPKGTVEPPKGKSRGK